MVQNNGGKHANLLCSSFLGHNFINVLAHLLCGHNIKAKRQTCIVVMLPEVLNILI